MCRSTNIQCILIETYIYIENITKVKLKTLSIFFRFYRTIDVFEYKHVKL